MQGIARNNLRQTKIGLYSLKNYPRIHKDKCVVIYRYREPRPAVMEFLYKDICSVEWWRATYPDDRHIIKETLKFP